VQLPLSADVLQVLGYGKHDLQHHEHNQSFVSSVFLFSPPFCFDVCSKFHTTINLVSIQVYAVMVYLDLLTSYMYKRCSFPELPFVAINSGEQLLLP
jgi:hypothetical protein